MKISSSFNVFLLTLLMLGCMFIFRSSGVSAATIVVNSTADSATDTGECTLREAVIAANTNTPSGITVGECAAGETLPVVDVIHFGITEPADYIIQGQSGYTISPQSNPPAITEASEVDGYSQTGSRENTAVSPSPLNGVLLIEINGNNIAGGIQMNADNVIIRGLILNRFDGTAVLAGGDNDAIMGNYIGVDPTGLIERPNGLSGINGSVLGFTDPDDLLIGSSDPADRNVISGNNEAGITPNVGQDRWVVKGNYIGVGADGVTAIPNSYPYNGPGGMSIDNCDGTIVGGSEVGATNVISGNGNFGIFPDNTQGLVIQGNIIGPDWRGEPLTGSAQQGGVGLVPIAGHIEQTMIGGAMPGEGNMIAHNSGPGVVVIDPFLNTLPLGSNSNAAIMGNSIFNNGIDPTYPVSVYGLGIDLMSGELSNQSITSGGVTLNDALDLDVGPNSYMNYPILNSVTQADNVATINFSLDAADSTNGLYRIEFFANDEADPSGYGEGQTFLGAITASNGSNQQTSLVLPSGYSLEGKFLSSTTTAINDQMPSGFGATSEFSRAMEFTSKDSTQLLAATGHLQALPALIGISLIVMSTGVLLMRVVQR